MEQSATKLHIVIGTKAQLIKMFPVMQELERRNLSYRLIDTGQHRVITRELRKMFGIRDPDVYLGSEEADITRILQALVWNLRIFWKSLARTKKIFGNGSGVCLVHGDTISTLQGLVMGKRAGMKIGHVEAGERTHNLWRPFPEEIIRRIVDRYADFAFSSSENSRRNLEREGIKGTIVDVGCNTIIDAVRIAAEEKRIQTELPSEYVLVSIHRFETIQSKARMGVLVQTLQTLSEGFEVVWGVHEPTRKQLVRFGLWEVLERNERIHLRGLWDYFSFVKAMKGCEFLITDGGGPQEESWFLNVPCMLMRSETEREQHQNVYLTRFETDRIEYFVRNYREFRAGGVEGGTSPSQVIVDFLEAELRGVEEEPVVRGETV